MSDTEDHILAEIVPPAEVFSLAEERRHFVLEHGARFIDESQTDMIFQLNALAMLERWLIDGSIPEPKDPKSKFKVVKKDETL